MAQFSQKERVVASILSATPWLKGIIKSVYIRVNSTILR